MRKKGGAETQPIASPGEARDTSLDDIATQYMGEPEPTLDELAIEAKEEFEEDNAALRELLKGLGELRKPELQGQVRAFAEKFIRSRRDARKEKRKKLEYLTQLKEKDEVIDKLLEDKEGAEHEANHDTLTGLLNRRGAYVELDEHLEYLRERTEQLKTASESEREKARPPLIDIILIDLDHFKRFNDKYGHQVGDRVLKIATKAIKDALRGEDDFAFRWGGEEIMVVLPKSSPGLAINVAERIRQEVEKRHIIIDSEKNLAEDLTASIGVAHFESAQELANQLGTVFTPQDRRNLIQEYLDKDSEMADQALYTSKDTGRNRVWMHGGIQDILEPAKPPPRKEVIEVIL